MAKREKNRIEELIPSELLDIAIPFIEFLKKYYEFLESEEYSPSSIINRDQILRNVESTSELFLQRIYQEVGNAYFINRDNSSVDVANLLKNLNILYEAKGSLDSIKILFRIIYGEDVDIYLPRELVLRPSDGNWDRQFSFMAELVSGDPLEIVGEFVTITSQFPGKPQQKIKAEVVRLENTEVPNLYEVFISKYAVNLLYYDASLVFDDVVMTTKPITDKLIYEKDIGTNFSLRKTYEVQNWTRNWFGDYLVNGSVAVDAGYSAPAGTTILEVNSTQGLVAGFSLYGDSALDSSARILSITDSDTLVITPALIATMPTTGGKSLKYSRYPDSYNTVLSPYFQELSGERRIKSVNPELDFFTETYVIASTMDGLKIETIEKEENTTTKVYYDQTMIRIEDDGRSSEYKTFVDTSVYPASDVKTNWDTVLKDLTDIARGDSSSVPLYTFFTTSVGTTANADSAKEYSVFIPAGTIDSAIGDSGTSLLYLSSVANVNVKDFIHGHPSIAAGTTISKIVAENKLITLSTPLLSRVDSAEDSDVYITVQSNISDSSTTVYLTNTAGLIVGDLIEGAGLDSDTIITSVDSATQITISKPHSGYVVPTPFDINNYQRGDINHSGSITLDDVELFVRKSLNRDVTDAHFYWIKNIIEDQLADSAPPASSFNVTTNFKSDSGSTKLIIDNTLGLRVGFGVSGDSVIPAETTISSIDSVSSVTLSNALTGDLRGDLATKTLTIGTKLGARAELRPFDLDDSNGMLDYTIKVNGYNYPTFFVGSAIPDSAVGENFEAVFQSSPISLSNATYTDNKGFLSDDIKLHDGEFYQDFSYVIQTDTLISEFRDILFKTTHPAGMKPFGELIAGTTISTDASASTFVQQKASEFITDGAQLLASDSTYMKPELYKFDSAIAADSGTVLTFGKNYEDSASPITEGLVKTIGMNSLADSASPITEGLVKTIGMNSLSDSATPSTTEVAKTFDLRSLSIDSAPAIDAAPILTFGKNPTDSAVAAEGDFIKTMTIGGLGLTTDSAAPVEGGLIFTGSKGLADSATGTDDGLAMTIGMNSLADSASPTTDEVALTPTKAFQDFAVVATEYFDDGYVENSLNYILGNEEVIVTHTPG